MLSQFTYWSRVWIIQELMLSENINLMYNDDLIEWDHFWLGVDDLMLAQTLRSALQLKYDIRGSYATRHYEQRRRRLTLPINERYTALNELLIRYAASQSMLVEDRIIGLLALIKGGSAFKNTYGGTRHGLALRVLIHFGCNFDTFGRVRYCLRAPFSSLQVELQSWTPSRLRRDYVEPKLYEGEVLRCPVGRGYYLQDSLLICGTCLHSFSDLCASVINRVELICLASLGSSSHMFYASQPVTETCPASHAAFFYHAKTKIPSDPRFVPKFESFLGIESISAHKAYVNIPLDLFVYLTECLRAPEPHGMTKVAGFAEADTHVVDAKAASLAFFDLLVPVDAQSKSGWTIDEWFLHLKEPNIGGQTPRYFVSQLRDTA